MSWNFRRLKRVVRDANIGVEWSSVGVHEVFYDPIGHPMSYSSNAISVIGETEAECLEIYDMMAEAFKKPVLDAADIGG